MREAVRLSLILMVICAITGAALAVTYAQTRPIIEEREAQALERSLQELLPAADRFEPQGEGEEENKVYYRGYKGQEEVGAVALFTQGGYGGDIRMMLGVEQSGKITGLQILEHSETPGLGARITEDWFVSQFAGRNVNDQLAIGQDLDAITGATISSRSVAGGVKLIAGEINNEFLGAGRPGIDISRVPNGTYQGEAQGFGGKTRVEVEVKDGRLVEVRIVENHDTAGISDAAIERIPQRMVEEQRVEVDTVSGATFSSQGIIEAVINALQEFAAPAEGGGGADLSSLPDGTYTGSGMGFSGPLEVEVTVAGGKITEIKVLSHSDSPGVSDAAIAKIPERIIEEQQVEVDVVTGASFTSRGIIEAVGDALAGAQ
ncbi:MAG TPA: RnfABCDGE type electron transport complex subunit G [Firmicutes bacterium]|nr:RnfABCDGE type electron transport complex subunit G [Bacillota bacterium]